MDLFVIKTAISLKTISASKYRWGLTMFLDIHSEEIATPNTASFYDYTIFPITSFSNRGVGILCYSKPFQENKFTS